MVLNYERSSDCSLFAQPVAHTAGTVSVATAAPFVFGLRTLGGGRNAGFSRDAAFSP